MTRARTDHERLSAVGNQASCVFARVLWNRNIPAQQLFVDAELLCEAEQCIEHMLSLRGMNAMRRKQPLELTRALAIESQFDPGGNLHRHQTGTQGELHVHEHVEMA